MKTNPFNKDKFKDIINKIQFYENEGILREVGDWAEFQQQASSIERRKSLNDDDILYSLVNLFSIIDVERLSGKDAMKYADIADRYGVLKST